MSATAAKHAFRLADDLAPIQSEIAKHHDESLHRLQDWIKHPAIAAEDRAMDEGCDYMARLAKDAGFQMTKRIDTDGHPAVFATYDAGAAKTFGLYYMYDVKQADPSEWSSPPFEARIVDKPGFGKVVMGRGAVNQKGPQAAFLAALHAIRAAGKKLPVNLVFVAEGEEEIGSPHFLQIVSQPKIAAALKRCEGVFMPHANQGNDGSVTINLGAKGVVECEIVSTADTWGRGPKKDVHSSNRARIDSPAWHLVQALNTLVNAAGDPAIDGLFDKIVPLSARDKSLLDEAARRLDEGAAKESLGVQRWARDASWRQSLEDLVAKPTVNIEGLVSGYTGPGGMTILPHRAAAKLDLRLVPNMTAADTFAKLKAHLAKRGFGDLDVKMSGGYDPNTTAADSRLIQAQIKVYERSNIKPILWPRLAGSWPGYVFTGAPLNLPAGHFGLCHGSRAHAPDEYFVIEPSDSKLFGLDAAVRSFVDYLHELA